jgi:cytochrome c peroxidase
MRHKRLIAIAAVSVSIATTLFISSRLLHAQNSVQEAAVQPAVTPPPPYNPYPPGILPSNIASELSRVQREIAGIFNNYLEQSKALPPVTYTGNPPIIQGDGYHAMRVLGGLLQYDLTMSPFKNRACASCHMPYAAFSGPIPSVNLTMVAYPGSYAYRAAKRTAQRYTYSHTFPDLNYNTTQGAFFGGNFWDSRATGYQLQAPDADQAQWPPLDPLEQEFPDLACIAYRISKSSYLTLWEQIWGPINIAWPSDTESICDTPAGAATFNGSTTPITLSAADRTEAKNIYDHWGQSLSFLERSPEVSPYTSKFDAFLAGKYTLTETEMAGYKLFRGKAGCNTCHLDGRGSTQTPGTGSDSHPSTTTGTDTSAAADTTPAFTCWGSANLGLPKNPRVALLWETTPDSFGFTPNPGGFTYTDFGLGTFLRSGFGSGPNPNSNWVKYAPASDGQMQVMSARDVALTPPQCPTTEAPGPYFQKEFFHNGYIKSLKQLVHFYNTRDVYRMQVESGECPAGTTEKVDCWPAAEVPQNQDMTTGNLGLTDEEENQIVAFLETLTDGYTTPYPFRNTYTGACMSGGNAATQGNSTIIPGFVLRKMMAEARQP